MNLPESYHFDIFLLEKLKADFKEVSILDMARFVRHSSSQDFTHDFKAALAEKGLDLI